MPLIIGVVLAVAVGLFGTTLGLDRDRAFYPVVTIVVASYYVLFAVMGAPASVLVWESLAGAAFTVQNYAVRRILRTTCFPKGVR